MTTKTFVTKILLPVRVVVETLHSFKGNRNVINFREYELAAQLSRSLQKISQFVSHIRGKKKKLNQNFCSVQLTHLCHQSFCSAVEPCPTCSTFTQLAGQLATLFLTYSISSSVPQRWNTRWPAWTSHLWGRPALSRHSVLWDSGPTSQPAFSNCPASQPCTRKCWVEVRGMRGRKSTDTRKGKLLCGARQVDGDNVNSSEVSVPNST